MPKIPTAGIGPKISTSISAVTVPVGSMNQEAEAFSGFADTVNNVMSKAGQILTEVEATDYFNDSVKAYESDRDHTIEQYSKQLNEYGRLPDGRSFEEAMQEWSSARIEDFTTNAPTDRAYSTVKDGMAPYDRKAIAEARAMQFDHVLKSQTQKTLTEVQRTEQDMKDYIPGDSQGFIDYAMEKLSFQHSALASKKGIVFNEIQHEDLFRKFGHAASFGTLESMERLEMYDGMAQILGGAYMVSPQAEAIIAEEMGLTPAELKTIINKRKQRGPQGKVDARESDVIGVWNNVTSLAGEAKPHYLEDFLTGGEKEAFLRSIVRGTKEQKKRRDGLLAERITQLKEVWSEGKGIPSHDAEAKQVLGQIAVTDSMEDWQKTKTMGELIAHRMLDKSLKRLPMASPTEARAIINSIPGQTREYMRLAEEVMEGSGVDIKNHYAYLTTGAQGTLNNIQAQLTQKHFSLMEQMGRDGAQYMIENNQRVSNKFQAFDKARRAGDAQKAAAEFKEFMDLNSREQDRMGQPYLLKRYIPKTLSKEFKAQLDDALNVKKDPNLLDSLIGTYEQAFGDRAHIIFDEMERNKDIDPSINYARMLPIDKRGVIMKDAAFVADIDKMSKHSTPLLNKQKALEKILDNETFSNFRSTFIMSGFPNNIGFINSVHEALANRVFVESVSKGKNEIKEDVVTDVMNNYFNSMVYNKKGRGYTMSIPWQHLQKIKPNISPMEADLAANVAKDILISDKYTYDIPPVILGQLKSLMIVQYPKEDFSNMPFEKFITDNRVQERFRKMLYDESETVAIDSRGFVLQIKGQTVGRIQDGKRQDVALPLDKAINDPRTTDELNKKLGPTNFQNLWKMLSK